ncbi:MAG TPA: hypothetical protein VHU40_14300, partial [Polyangia bacterium]|nr:hypothetical protein [Polyangia bacterium]
MKALPPLSPEVQALLVASRVVAPLPPSVEARCLARSRAAAASIAWVPHRTAPASRWIFAGAAAAVVAVGAAAYAAHTWLVEEPADAVETPAPVVRAVVTTRSSERSVPVVAVAPAVEPAPSAAAPRLRGRSRGRVTTAHSASVAELQLLMSVREDVV